MADPFNKKKFTVRMLHPIEVITVSKRMAIVDVGSLVEIPTELQVRQAVSELYKKERNFQINIHK